jgi:hypothetical protein
MEGCFMSAQNNYIYLPTKLFVINNQNCFSGKFKKINASQDGHHTYQCRMLSCSQGWWPG